MRTSNLNSPTASEMGSTVRIFEGTNPKGTTTAGPGGAWSRSLGGVPDGSHAYTARATDAAGNTSGASNARTLIVDTVRPTTRGVYPASGATGVAPGVNVTAAFSEAMNPATLSKTTVRLIRKGATTPVAAALGRPAPNKVVLNPSSSLRSGATYTATVTTGARDRAGNALASNKVWRFTVR